MKAQMLAATIAAALLASVTAANAKTINIDTPIDILGDYTISYSPIDGNGPTISPELGDKSNNKSPPSYSFNEIFFSPNELTKTTQFFIAAPKSDCGRGCKSNTAEGTITVDFSFLYDGIKETADITGTYLADYSGTMSQGACKGDRDCIIWSMPDPLIVAFANLPNYDLSIDLPTVSDWDLKQGITFQLVDPVPLPAALPLFAGGLGVLGWFVRRRRVKNAALAV
jgi:hypothetical protein